MNITTHAKQQWVRRFPTLNFDEEYGSAARSKVGRRLIARIKKQCPYHAYVTTRHFQGYYYKRSRSNIIFVITPPETIVTVFPLNPKCERKEGV